MTQSAVATNYAALPCLGAPPTGSQILAQTLFLGSSVVSYSVNMGWGGQPSSLSVELVNDPLGIQCSLPDGSPDPQLPLFKPRSYPDNHYHECIENDCYVDELGDPFNPNRQPTPPLSKNIPGKLHYTWTPQKGFVSRYWFNEDPGFFGDFTKIDIAGNYRPSDFFTSYDIIGTPVYFALDKFVFGGVVQGWEKNIRLNQTSYSVSIEGPNSLLDNSWIILKDYAGSVFSKLNPGSLYGGPLSYVRSDDGKSLTTSIGRLKEGNLHNVFNVYGFLQSFGNNSFGVVPTDDSGIPYVDVLDSLSVLTSCERGPGQVSQLDFGTFNKRAFSPFGRILGKVIQEDGSFLRPAQGLGFGTLDPGLDDLGLARNFFVLDLSELPRPPRDYKITGDIISISDFIRSLTSVMGQDFFAQLIPAFINGIAYNVIKIKVVDRTSQPAKNQIANTISKLSQNGYNVEVNGIGQEINDSSSPRVMYVGGKQERLYQTKSYRLGFKQTSFIYNPAIDRFVDFNIMSPLGRGNQNGKTRVPVAFSVRNPVLGAQINGTFATNVFDQAEEINFRLNQVRFNLPDPLWVDTEVGGNDQIRAGNYAKSIETTTPLGVGAGPVGTDGKSRYIPIYMDTICPFFGYVSDEKIEISTDGGSNNFRKIRPVWFDTWTGQLVIVCHVSELPPITMGTSSLLRTSSIPSFLDGGYFLITETELRSAMDSFDSYLTYCHSKSILNKPQLYTMLLSAYYYAHPSFANTPGRGEGVNGGWVRNAVGAPIPFLPPENVFVVQANNANNNGQPGNGGAAGNPGPAFSLAAFIDPRFIKDLMILCGFISALGNKFYGQKYMVRVGEISTGRDRTYSDFDIPASTYTGGPGEDSTIAVFAGTGKIFFNREPCETAWEEYGNVIDDSFVVGSEAWYALIGDDGKIPPLLGYNASDSYDWEARRLCGLRVLAASWRPNERGRMRQRILSMGGLPNNPSPELQQHWDSITLLYGNAQQIAASPEVVQSDSQYGNMVKFFLTAQGVCSDEKFIFQSLNLNNLSKNDFVLMNTRTPRQDAYGRIISAGQPPPDFRPPILLPNLRFLPFSPPGGMAKKLFLKAQVEGMGFMDNKNLKDARAILTCPGIKLSPPSLTFGVDPTRTVVCNAALEELIVYLKMVLGINPTYNQNYVDRLLMLIRGYDAFTTTYTDPKTGSPVIGPRSTTTLWPNMGFTTNVSKDHATLAPKAAHPYFAAVPMRYNEYCYGPWTNYPNLVADTIFLPGLREQLNSYISRVTKLIQDMGGLIPDPRGPNFDTNRKILTKEIRILQLLIERFNIGLGSFASGNAIENLLGSVKVEIDPDLVPWNYGGMSLLDKAVIGLINSNTDFQQTLETAQITISASPIFGIGGEFTFYDRSIPLPANNFRINSEVYQSTIDILTYTDVKTNPTQPPNIPIIGKPYYIPPPSSSLISIPIVYRTVRIRATNRTGLAPIITNMSTRFDVNGFSTTYSFKTYARKLGLYSKQNADRLKKSAENTLKVNKSIFSLKNSIITGNIGLSQSGDNESVPAFSVSGTQTKLFGTSPTEVLIGSAAGFLPSRDTMQLQLQLAFPVTDYQTMVPTLPPLLPLSLTGRDIGDLPVDYNSARSIASKYRHRSWVGMFQQWELKSELEEGYDEKSAMSMDGLLSPVSFHPTLLNSTYSMMPYAPIVVRGSGDLNVATQGVSLCPVCRGLRKITHQYRIGSPLGAPIIADYACPGCSKGLPDIVANPNSVSGVNAMNLQPIVVPYGIWSNAHAQPHSSGERQRHSIRVVGRNQTPPFDPAVGLSLDTDKNKEIFRDPLRQNRVVEDGVGNNVDFHPVDMAKFFQNGGYYPNNQRFFALRGPLTMHGWGYDISGFPVPNAADEPVETDIHNRPKRFKLTASGTNDYTSDGVFTVAESPQYGLGDVVGKGWAREDGIWQRKPSQYFYVNWAERPDLWPVGPIDLRWDYDRRVWVGGGAGGECTGNDLPPFIISDTNDVALLSKFTSVARGKCAYKPVYITLEEDMIKEKDYDETYPTRGFIDDIQYSKEPLPNKSRRLVFIKDKAGYTAPRGAKLLCRYDNDTGFYEPLSKQTYFVFGRVVTGNTAVVDLSYIQGKHRGSNTPTMTVVFDNTRFNFETDANSKGMFYYENGSWILVSNNKINKSPGI